MIPTNFRPLLAAKTDDKVLDNLQYPVLGSIKLDGIRCIILNGQAVTRSLKPIPNNFIREYLSKPEYAGLDGEILCADPADPDCYNKTQRAVMSIEGEPEFTFYVFDCVPDGNDDVVFSTRQMLLTHQICSLEQPHRLLVVEQDLLSDRATLDRYEAKMVALGHEGIMLRSPEGRYKFGRSTAKEGTLLKVKRFSDSEAEVLEMVEEMRNTNAATTDKLGHTERSSDQAGLVGKACLGSVRVRDLTSGVEFHIGTGFTRQQREDFWREGCVGKIFKYKFFPIGVKDLPRFPTFKGIRSLEDL